MNEKKSLHTIAEWEGNQPAQSYFKRVHFRLGGSVTKVSGSYNGSACYWDGFGIAYHYPSGKRFPSADIHFKPSSHDN